MKLKPTVDEPARKLSQLINIVLKPLSKLIKSFTLTSFDFLIKCSRDIMKTLKETGLT